MALARIETSRWEANCYVASSAGGDAVVIDPGGDFDRIVAAVTAGGLRPRAVLATHAHYDHVAAATPVLGEYGIPFHLHPDDRRVLSRANLLGTFYFHDALIEIPPIDVELEDGAELRFGDLGVGVVHTPGHTPGSVCFAIGGELFTGDTLMEREAGRTDIAGGDHNVLEASVATLAERWPAATTIHPGHGEPSTLGEAVANVAETSRTRT